MKKTVLTLTLLACIGCGSIDEMTVDEKAAIATRVEDIAEDVGTVVQNTTGLPIADLIVYGVGGILTLLGIKKGADKIKNSAKGKYLGD